MLKFLFLFFISFSWAKTKPKIGPGSSSSSSSSGGVVEAEGLIYAPGTNNAYDTELSANVKTAINCTIFQDQLDQEVVGECSSGSDWCSWYIEPETDDHPMLNETCAEFCTEIDMFCIDSYTSLCGASDRIVCADGSNCACDRRHDASHSCVCWDSETKFVEREVYSERDFVPMIILISAFPSFFFLLALAMYWKTMEDAEEFAK